MTYLCGRYRIDVGMVESMGPGEFEDYMEGVLDRERELKVLQAATVSAVAGWSGARVSVTSLLGEVDDADYEIMKPTPEEQHRANLDEQRRQRQKKAEGWLPPGLALDEQE